MLYCVTLLIAGYIHDTELILVSNLTISEVENIGKTNICNPTFMVDLKIQGQTFFQMTFVISG